MSSNNGPGAQNTQLDSLAQNHRHGNMETRRKVKHGNTEDSTNFVHISDHLVETLEILTEHTMSLYIARDMNVRAIMLSECISIETHAYLNKSISMAKPTIIILCTQNWSVNIETKIDGNTEMNLFIMMWAFG